MPDADEIRRARRREAQRRWREKNRERVRELNRQWRERNREKTRAYQKRWRQENPEKNREKKRRWRERGGYHRYYWKYRERCLARLHAYRARISQHWPAFGELQKAALLANETYAAVHAVVPAGLPKWLRDDVISEVVLSILEGRAAVADAAAEAKAAISRHRAALYRELSLNAPAFEGGPDRIDLLRAEENEWIEE